MPPDDRRRSGENVDPLVEHRLRELERKSAREEERHAETITAINGLRTTVELGFQAGRTRMDQIDTHLENTDEAVSDLQDEKKNDPTARWMSIAGVLAAVGGAVVGWFKSGGGGTQ